MSRCPAGEKLFTVGLVADTHCNEHEDFSASPYPANAKANARARHAIGRLNAARPAFIVHLGDMVNPVPELPTYDAAAGEFWTIANRLDVPLHLVPGNHDIGDKPVGWVPAGTVNEDFITRYEGQFGQHHYAFEHEDIRFIVINAALINSGLEAEIDQRTWLESEFKSNGDTRSFVFIHYPPFVSNPDEPDSYDNIDEPGRSWLLGLIRRYRPEAMFAAHVHNFWYNVVGDTEFYVLPSTCFVRHDYSELYRIEPGDQFGRNDTAKLGYVLLDIHQTGHVAHYRRTHGACAAPDASDPLSPDVAPLVHTKASTLTSFGVDMRRPWAEELDIAASGAVDEFTRKRARNDYPLMALWEMGLRRMRVPIQDLLDARVRGRMELLAAAGHLFHVYCYGCPDKDAEAVLTDHGNLVDLLEVVINWEKADATLQQLHALKARTGVRLCLSRVNRKDTAKHEGSRFNHLISHGFGAREEDEIAQFLARHDTAGAISAVMFAVPRDACPWQAALAAERFAAECGRRVCLYIKSSAHSPAEAFIDDGANAARAAHAVFAAATCQQTDVIFDTFTDADRGYFVRTGLVDRRYNPRQAGRVVANLTGLLNGTEWHADTSAPGPRLKNGAGMTLALATDRPPQNSGEHVFDLNDAADFKDETTGPFVIRSGGN